MAIKPALPAKLKCGGNHETFEVKGRNIVGAVTSKAHLKRKAKRSADAETDRLKSHFARLACPNTCDRVRSAPRVFVSNRTYKTKANAYGLRYQIQYTYTVEVWWGCFS